MATPCRAALTSMLVLSLASGNLLGADHTQPAATAAQNVNHAVNGNLVTVNFDLPVQAGATYTVSVDASANGGVSYDIKPKTMTGDVGRGIAGGPGKRIVWEAARDTENLQLDRLRFRVSAAAETAPAAPAAPTTPANPSSGTGSRITGGGQVASPVTPKPGKRGSPPLKWTGITLLGAGATIAVLATAGPLKSDCFEFAFTPPRNAEECTSDTEVNKAALGLGAGVAAGGAALWFLGRGSEAPAQIVPIRRGVFVRGRIRF